MMQLNARWRITCLPVTGSNGLGPHGAAAEAEGLLPDS